jgi:RND family efflux transporter MFP subunit
MELCMIFLLNHRTVFFSLLTLTLAFGAGCGKEVGKNGEELHTNHRSEHTETSIVQLDKHKVFHAGIQVAPVEKKSVAIPLTLPGKVSYNEQRFAHITARVTGRVEKVRTFTNARVQAGEVLLELYSQEYLTMQHEFLQAAKRWRRRQLSDGDDRATAKAIYESTRQKLIVTGATSDELDELEASQTPKSYFFVRAPFPGTILQSKVRLGSFVQVGTELFDVADLSTLWLLADIYEKDLSRVRTGMKALVEVSAYPDSFEGTISTIYGVVDEKTRTVKARVEVRNQGGKLKPEMFCTVKVQTELGKGTIKIPTSALLGETERHFVFIALNDTTFERRDVRTGVETREFAEVLDGLLVGEKIVVKGGFFLKSELVKETFGEEH